MRKIILIAFLVGTNVGALLSDRARANDRVDCEGQDPAGRLVACTRMIESGQLPRLPLSYTYNNRGMGHVMLGDVDRGLKDFDRAIAINPELETAHLNRGYAHVFQMKLNEAVDDFGRAMKAKPDWAAPYVGRAIVHFMNGATGVAIVDLTAAIAIDPDHPEAYLNRGVLYRSEGELAKAIADFTVVLKLDPQNAEAQEQLKELSTNPRAGQRLPSGVLDGTWRYAPMLGKRDTGDTLRCTLRRQATPRREYACLYH